MGGMRGLTGHGPAATCPAHGAASLVMVRGSKGALRT